MTAAVLVSTVAVAGAATAAPTAPADPASSHAPDPDVSSPVASAGGAAREAARAAAPSYTPSRQPARHDAVTVARMEAARTGAPTVVEGETSESSILYALPDGSLQRQLSAGPVRVRQGEDWVPIDTDLAVNPDSGVLQPAAVVGERSFSNGGDAPMAVLGGDGASLSFGWPTSLPTPTVQGDTATYRDVFPGVDLQVTATSLGFSQQLVVKEPLADPSVLSAIEVPVDSTGAAISASADGTLQVTDTAGDLFATAGAPLMWDADGGLAAGNEDVDASLTGSGHRQQLVLSPDLAFLSDPATVYPVTIDPAPAMTAMGDTFIRNTTPDAPQAGTAVLPVGSPDPAEQNEALLRFDVKPVAGHVVIGASLQLWNSYSATCDSKWTDIYRVEDFDPATVTWNSSPASRGWIASSDKSFGFDAGCPAGTVSFDVGGPVADAMRAQEVFAVGVSTDQDDTAAYKVFNSGTAADHVPTLNVTYGDDCEVVDGYYICDEILAAWQADGGEAGWGAPLQDISGTAPQTGSYQIFANGAIFWSPSTGAHAVSGEIFCKWHAMGNENSWLGFPTTDMTTLGGGAGYSQDFQHGSIYWSGDTGAHAVRDDYVAHYRSIGAQDGYLGYPTSDSYAWGSGGITEFAGGELDWDQASNTIQHFADYPSFGGQPGWATQLDYQLSDTVDAKVNVGTGNLNVSIAGLAVPGIGQDRSVGLTYNSYAAWGDGQSRQGSLVGPLFRLTDAPDTRLVTYADQSVRYVDPSGRVLLYRWNGSAYEAPVGDGGTKLERNAANDWVLTTLTSNRKQTFRASDGLLISDADRNGNTYSFAYDANGLPTSITGTRGGAPITFTVNGDGYLTSMQQSIDGVVRKIGLGYDEDSGLLTSVTDASGNTTTFEWTDWDLTSVTDPRGNTTAFQYDDTHMVVQVVRDYGGANLSTGLAWDTENRNGINTLVTRVTTPNDQVTNYTIDGFSKVLDVTDPLGHKKATTYSPNNDVATAVDAMPAANTTTYSYNGADGGYTPTGITAPTGASATASYPATGNGPQRYQPTSSTDTQGNTTTYAYDTAGNPTQQVTGGVITSTTYNPPAGQPTTCGGKPGQPCTSTDGRGNTTTFTYDGSGNLVTVTPPASGVIEATHYTYDGAGRPKTVTDGNNRVTTYVYDKNDRVTQVRYNGATSCATAADCEVYTYDAAGNLTKRVDQSGTTKYGYDSLNRLSTEVSPAASGGGSKTATLTYDLAGNLVNYTDANGTTKYGYDAGNNLTWLAEPGGSCTGTVSKCTRYEYNDNDARTKITYPGGTTVNYLNIDASGRPLQYKATKSTGQVFMDFTYNYTGGNGDTSLVQSRSDATVTGTAVQTYTYDGLNRLTRALEKVGANTTASWTYCYDAAGNRTYDSTATDATVPCPGDAGGPAATYTYDATNALTGRAGQPASAFSYDGNGAELAAVGTNTRTGATWTTHGQLTAVTAAGTAHSYSYAGEGNKERLTADGTGYQNAPLGVTSQTGTNANQVIREPNGTAVALRVGGVSYYYIADRQGSIISLVSSTGIERNHYSYDPYGVSRTKTEAVVNPWQYIGGYLDVTGLYHLQHRYYDPTTGRFSQTDPSGQEANVYLYSGANPINFDDPTGLSFRRKFIAVLRIGGDAVAAGVGFATCAETAGAGCAAGALAFSDGLDQLTDPCGGYRDDPEACKEEKGD